MEPMRYRIFTDATADLSPDLLARIPSVEIIPMEVEIGGRTWTYGPGGDLVLADFYRFQREGQYATTSQIRPAVYEECFRKALDEGQDVLYLCFSSALSGTIGCAMLTAEELRRQYPDRKIAVIDTFCASIGEGFLVREACRKQAEGLSFEELSEWVCANRLRAAHTFAVDSFDHLRHGGRVSALAAAVGGLLQIKPFLTVNDVGALQVIDKPRGQRAAVKALLSRMEKRWSPEAGRLVVVAHGDNPEGFAFLRECTARRFPSAEILFAEIGPIIGAHTGPGMLALVYWCDER